MKTRKSLLIISLVMLLLPLLSSCATETSVQPSQPRITSTPEPTPTVVPTKEPPRISTFVIVNEGWITNLIGQIIMYDPETMVMYTAFISQNYREGYRPYEGIGLGLGFSITPMYNADGTLRLYNPEN